MSELKVYHHELRHNEYAEFCLKYEVDAVLAEKDKEIMQLKQKLEDVQASMYCDVVDANMENRRLRRALWLARADRAGAEACLYAAKYGLGDDGYIRWRNAEKALIKKAKEYK